MKCYQCNAHLPEGAKNCPVCGKNQIFTPMLIQAAMDGDQDAVSQLYNRTYNAVYQTVKSMIRDEDTVMDILQDSYVKAFQNMGQLRTPEMFPAWIKQIANNTAKDWLKRKKPILFTELENEDGEMTLDFEDDRTDNLPEEVIDQKETTRLVNEILDSLSDEQRVVVGLFYYQQLSVKEIAEMLDCSENTVKSRLNYARKKIKVEVEDLERRGTKLYSLSPIPFLLWLFRGMQTQAAETPAQAVLEAVLAECTDLSAGGTSAGAAAQAGGVGAKAAAGAVGKTLAAKIAAGVLAVVVLSAGAAVILPAVTGQGDETPLQTAEVTTPDPAEETDLIEEAMEQYRIVVSQASSYSYSIYAEPNGNYRYALVQMQPDDPVPTLLLAQETIDNGKYVRVFQYDPDSRTLRQPPETLYEGKGSLAMSEDGNGIFEHSFNGATGELWIYRATLEGDSLNKPLVYEGRIDDERPDAFRSVPIEWHDIGELVTPSETPTEVPLPEDGDRLVLQGTIRTYTYDELLDMLGYPDPNAEYADKTQTFRLFLLDEPQTMRLVAYGNKEPFAEKTATMIDISRAEGLEQYDGQHLFISIDPNEAYWPSDTSIPLREPRARDVHVLQ